MARRPIGAITASVGVVALAVGVACGGSGSDAPAAVDPTAADAAEPDVGSVDANTPPQPHEGGAEGGACRSTGFESTATAFTLPAGFARVGGDVPFGGLVSGARRACPTYDVIDMDGDGRLDLVLMDDCDPSHDPTTWRIHAGTPSGFDPTGRALPSVAAVRPGGGDWPATRAGDPPAVKNHYAALADVDGDKKPDLVLAATIPPREWLLYRQTATGFEEPPIVFADPEPSCGTPVVRLHGLVDLDGDGKVDLVETGNCHDPIVGDAVWRTYRGAATGFVAPPDDVALPTDDDVIRSLPLVPPQLVICAGGAGSIVDLVDVDGDRKPDIVGGGCGKGITVHLGNGASFGVGSKFPSTLASAGRSETSCDESEWFLRDIDGDGRADFVVTKSCADLTTGGALQRIIVASGRAGTFAAPVDWKLPAGAIPDIHYKAGDLAFDVGEGTCPGDPSRFFSFFIRDVTGDGLADLVVTASCTDADAGVSKWLVYRGRC